MYSFPVFRPPKSDPAKAPTLTQRRFYFLGIGRVSRSKNSVIRKRFRYQNFCSSPHTSKPNLRNSIADTARHALVPSILNRHKPTTIPCSSRIGQPQLPSTGSLPFSKTSQLWRTYSVLPSSGSLYPVASTDPSENPEYGLSIVIVSYVRR